MSFCATTPGCCLRHPKAAGCAAARRGRGSHSLHGSSRARIDADRFGLTAASATAEARVLRLEWKRLRMTETTCTPSVPCSSRVAIVLSASAQRATHTLSVLRRSSAFEAVARLTPQPPRATFESKIASNWLAFVEALDAAPGAWAGHPSCCERWLYLFEDDVDVHPQLRGEAHAVARALLAAEARAESLGRPVVYAGLCGTRCANRSKVTRATRHAERFRPFDCSGPCAHAWGVRLANRSAVRAALAPTTALKTAWRAGRRVVFDRALESAARAVGGFPLAAARLCGGQTGGHCGVFFQDRVRFGSTIGSGIG